MDWKKLFWNERGEAGAQGTPGGDGATQGGEGGEGGTQQQAQEVVAKLSPEAIAAIEAASGKSAAEAVEKALEAKKANEGGTQQDGGTPSEEVPAWLQNMVKPMMDQAHAASFQAQAAADSTEFYARHPEALKYRAEIDNQFADFAKAGRPTFREDIYRWMTGEGGVLQQRIVADRATAAKDAETRAAAAVTAGAGASRVVEPPKAVEDMSGQELDTFMADKVF